MGASTSVARIPRLGRPSVAWLLLIGAVPCLVARSALPQNPSAPEQVREPAPAIDPAAGESLVPLPTLGGKQFWADELLFHQWRIQRNVLTDQCRLLDADNWRWASGSFAECAAVLKKIKRERHLPPMHGKAVIVLHGLGRNRATVEPICRYLRENSDYTVFNVGYPSTQRDVAGHARALAGIIDRLDGISEINFVAHSLGNLIVRHYFHDRQLAGPGAHPHPRLGRMVMLGPPNHGSEVAAALAESDFFAATAGRPGLELGARWAELESRLAVPPCQFGVIAGGLGTGQGFNPLLAGDDDGLVTVASTRLAGASDFVIVPVLHTFLPRDGKVLEYTLRFLKNGYFLSPQEQQPIR